MRVYTSKELGLGLGCVIYDSMMLLSALLIYHSRYSYAFYRGLNWGPSQIAIDVLHFKSRVLMDFISPPASTWDSIVITDFGLKPVTLAPHLKAYRRSVNQWVAHLAWGRVLRLSKDSPQPQRSKIEKNSLWLLTTANKVFQDCIAGGICLTEERHKKFYTVFQRELAAMKAFR